MNYWNHNTGTRGIIILTQAASTIWTNDGSNIRTTGASKRLAPKEDVLNAAAILVPLDGP